MKVTATAKIRSNIRYYKKEEVHAMRKIFVPQTTHIEVDPNEPQVSEIEPMDKSVAKGNVTHRIAPKRRT